MSPLNQVLVQWFVKCLCITLANHMLSIRNWTMWHKNILYDKRSLQSDVHLETMEAVPTRCLLMKSIKYEVLMSADTQTLHSNNITDFCKTTINCTTHNNYTIRNNTQTDTEATCLMLTPRLSSKKSTVTQLFQTGFRHQRSPLLVDEAWKRHPDVTLWINTEITEQVEVLTAQRLTL